MGNIFCADPTDAPDGAHDPRSERNSKKEASDRI